jgi:hypothetical protein
MVLPAGISPATSAFEARRSIYWATGALELCEVAEAGGHAPHTPQAYDLFSRQSRRAGPVRLPVSSRSLRLDLHQHLTAYETAALLIMLRSEKRGDQRDLHPYRGFHRAECSLLHHGLHPKVGLRPALPRHVLLYERSAFLSLPQRRIGKVALPRGFAPRPSAFARRHAWLLHLGSFNKMAAAAGIAPASPPLQGGANLSQLSSQTAKLVPPRGNAPRSIGYLPMALLLSYGGIKWLPNVDSHHDNLINSQTCYFDIIGEGARTRTCTWNLCR